MSGIIKMVHKSEDPDGPFKTISEVAEHLGKSKDTIRRWGSVLGIPNHKMPLGEGQSYVWLYTEEDVLAMEKYSETVKFGRPASKESG